MGDDYTDASWLEQKYWEEGMTQAEIAELANVTTRTIRRHMDRHDIDTRDIEGENHPLHGEQRPEAVRAAISETLDGRGFSAASRAAMAEAHRGKTVTEAIRAKIAESLTGTERDQSTRAAMSESTAGEQNPNWKGGYSRRYGPGWAPARDAVRERDGVCQHCGHDGSERRLEVHHIVPVRRFRERPDRKLREAHDLKNLALLCRRCHGKADHGSIDVEPPATDGRQ